MDVRVRCNKLNGKINALPYIPIACRTLICDYLAEQRFDRQGLGGIPIKYTQDNIRTILVSLKELENPATSSIDVLGDSLASALLIPVFAALRNSFNLEFSEIESYNKESGYIKQFQNCGMNFKQISDNSFLVEGRLLPGTYLHKKDFNDITSGLLLALPLLEDISYIKIREEKIPKDILITLEIAKRHKIRYDIKKFPDEYVITVFPNQEYHRTETAIHEKDWCGATNWIAANAINSKIIITGLSSASTQEEKVFPLIINDIKTKEERDIDLTATPDLFPITAIMALVTPGVTNFTNVSKYRYGESDRVESITYLIEAIDGEYEFDEEADVYTIYGIGKKIKNKKDTILNLCNDHRMVMACTVLTLALRSQAVIRNAESVKLSYPNFFIDYKMLGGDYVMIN